MTTLRDRHLGRVANRLASLLPGADNEAIYSGAREVLDAEIARVFELAVIRRGEDRPPISYAQALSSAVVSSGSTSSSAHGSTAGHVVDEAIGVLLSGLSGPATLAAGERERLSADTLTQDLEALLHAPELRVLARTSKPEDLLAAAGTAHDAGEVVNPKTLRLGHAVSMRVSFNAARELLANPVVLGWQVSGEIVLSEDEAGR